MQYAILFDRLFRFPVTGDRVRNYDGLGGQLLFAYLHKHDVVRWTDNTLRIDWERGDRGHQRALRRDRARSTGTASTGPSSAHWFAAYELVAALPRPRTRARGGRRARTRSTSAQPPRKLVDDVLPDEFPLSMFYEALAKKLRDRDRLDQGDHRATSRASGEAA